MPFASLLSLLLLAPLVHRSPPAIVPAPRFVTLSYQASSADVLVTVNGFPVVRERVETSGSGGMPINLHLLPTGNRLEISARPLEGADAAPSLMVGISDGMEGDIVDTTEPGRIVTLTVGPDDGTHEASDVFDLPADWGAAFTYGERYGASPVLEDENRLRAYAVTLLSLFQARDFEALVPHVQPKLDDVGDAFDAAAQGYDMRAEFVGSLQAQFDGVPADPVPAASAVVLRPWADGRVWELALDNERSLFHADLPDGSTVQLPIYVADVDGELRVIR